MIFTLTPVIPHSRRSPKRVKLDDHGAGGRFGASLRDRTLTSRIAEVVGEVTVKLGLV